MKNSLKAIPAIVIGAIFIILTLFVFLSVTSAPRGIADWLGLSFILLSELAVFGYALYFFSASAKSGRRIYQVGILSTLTVYWVVTLMLSLFRNVFADNIKYFILLNAALIGITAIISVLLNSAASFIQTSNSRTKLELENKQFTKGKRGDF